MDRGRRKAFFVLTAMILSLVCLLPVFSTGKQGQPAVEAAEAPKEVAPKDVTLTIFARAYTWEQEAPWKTAKAEIQKRWKQRFRSGDFSSEHQYSW